MILDEIHKYRHWRNTLKGLFDAMQVGVKVKQEVLVTGSARLDHYRFGGDSLQGRYYYLRLMPLSFAELKMESSDLESLFVYGGFPEPFSRQSIVESQRWSRQYQARLVREDLRDLEQVQNLAGVEQLLIDLPRCVGSPLSINALREDLQVAHQTVAKWILILEKLYAVFRIPPMGGSKIHAVKKEQKLYFFDWSAISDEGARFENLIACHLLKHVYWLEDTRGLPIELRYFRDKDAREVDFIILENFTPILLIECKLREQQVSQSLKYLKGKYKEARAFQIHFRGEKDYQTKEGIFVCPASRLLKELT